MGNAAGLFGLLATGHVLSNVVTAAVGCQPATHSCSPHQPLCCIVTQQAVLPADGAGLAERDRHECLSPNDPNKPTSGLRLRTEDRKRESEAVLSMGYGSTMNRCRVPILRRHTSNCDG